MKKLVRYGLLLIVVLMIGLSFILVGTQIVYATGEEAEAIEEDNYTPAEKAAAIKAANDAILRIPQLQYIVALDQAAINYVAEARSLVQIAIENYDATDSDFPGLATLIEAERRVAKLVAVKAAQDAIDAIPQDPFSEEYREAVEQARRLVDFAMQEYGATYFDICWRYDALLAAEDKLDEEPEPEPEPEPIPDKPDDRRQTPPTGGFSVAAGMGLLASGVGLLLIKRRQDGLK